MIPSRAARSRDRSRAGIRRAPHEPPTDAVLPEPRRSCGARAPRPPFSTTTSTGTPTTATGPITTAPPDSRPTSSTAASIPARSSRRLGRSAPHETPSARELALARVLRRRAVPPAGLRPAAAAGGGRPHPGRHRRGGRPALRRVGRGRTGYPIVDAGMRQLIGEGWMHNRVRMIVASFLVKDLHLDWRRGARLFMERLVDGDLASNAHGWQWVAGTGTDAAPYHRIFNPTLQGKRFDPDGDVRAALGSRAGRHRRRRGPRAVEAHRTAARLPGADRRPRRGAARGAGPLLRGASRLTVLQRVAAAAPAATMRAT